MMMGPYSRFQALRASPYAYMIQTAVIMIGEPDPPRSRTEQPSSTVLQILAILWLEYEYDGECY